MTRLYVIHTLVELIDSIQLEHPVRVGIDGVDASGKTMLADELVSPLQSKGRTVIRASIDGFHNAEAIRYQQGRLSPQGFYEDSFNFEAVVANVLLPLGPHGNLKYRSILFDSLTDAEVPSPVIQADPESILLFDGIFLHHPMLREYWDYSIFVQAGFGTTLRRAKERDLHIFNTEDKVQKAYEQRYIPGQQIYLEAESPAQRANVILGNDDIERPEIRMNDCCR